MKKITSIEITGHHIEDIYEGGWPPENEAIPLEQPIELQEGQSHIFPTSLFGQKLEVALRDGEVVVRWEEDSWVKSAESEAGVLEEKTTFQGEEGKLTITPVR